MKSLEDVSANVKGWMWYKDSGEKTKPNITLRHGGWNRVVIIPKDNKWDVYIWNFKMPHHKSSWIHKVTCETQTAARIAGELLAS